VVWKGFCLLYVGYTVVCELRCSLVKKILFVVCRLKVFLVVLLLISLYTDVWFGTDFVCELRCSLVKKCLVVYLVVSLCDFLLNCMAVLFVIEHFLLELHVGLIFD
jgi:hypothetical protein